MRSAIPVAAFNLLLTAMGATVASPEENPLHGEWEVEEPRRVAAGYEPMPRFRLDAHPDGDRDVRVLFKVACNSYAGKASVAGTRIRFDVEAGTLKACSEELLARDRDFVRRLEAVTSLEISRRPEVPFTRVRLNSKDGTTLVILRAGR